MSKPGSGYRLRSPKARAAHRGRVKAYRKTAAWSREMRRKSSNGTKQRRRRALREEAIAALGERCTCCNEHRIELLTVHHPHGGGNDHRRKMNYIPYYKYILSHLDEFECHCFNCNSAKGAYGYCPHEIEREVEWERLREGGVQEGRSSSEEEINNGYRREGEKREITRGAYGA